MPKVNDPIKTPKDWHDSNPILGVGQVGVEKYTKKYKIGDGATPWNGLEYGVRRSDLAGLGGFDQEAVLALVREAYINAAKYGWSPTATAAVNEKAFNDARDAAYTAKLPLYLGKGVFQKTLGLDLRASDTRADGLQMFGSGRSAAQIVVNTNTSELLMVGGYGHVLNDFTIKRSILNPDANTAGGLVFYKAAYSTFKRINIYTASSLVMISPTDVHEPGTNAGSGSYMFSCTFEDISLNRYKRSGINLQGVGSTGSTWTNTYVQNGSPGAALTATGAAVELVGLSEQIFNQLNIEDLEGFGTAVLLNASHVVINGLHFERARPGAWHANFIRVYGVSSLDISAVTVSFTDLGGAGTSEWVSLFSVALGGVLTARGVWVADCTKTSGSVEWRLVEVDDTDARNSITIETPMVKDGSPAFNKLTSSTTANGIKRIGDPVIAASFARRVKTGAATAVNSYDANAIVPLDTAPQNVGSKIDTATTNSFVAKASGLYRALARVSFTGGTSAKHSIITKVNNVTKYENALTFAGAGVVPNVAPGDDRPIYLNVGDVVTFAAYVETGSVMIDSTTDTSTVASLLYLGA